MRYEPGQIIDTDLIPAEAVTELCQQNSDDSTPDGYGIVIGVVLGLALYGIAAAVVIAVWGA